ncbi:MAG: CinA family protein [Proteobacteria bacterium]|nr:CinA family protein [Pseudomonadota bacterium]
MFPPELIAKATKVLNRSRSKAVRIVTAESCTGGLLIACLTEIAGSSDVVDRGFVPYTNEAKQQQLGVAEDLFYRAGAVSEEVAQAMVEGALTRSDADVAVSCTGIAGPGGATENKPIGLVHLAGARRGGKVSLVKREYGDIGRNGVRLATIDDALEILLKQIDAVT